MAQFRTSRAFDLIFLLILGALLWWAAINRVAVGDWIYFTRYQPDARTSAIATAAGFSDQGRRLFYRTNPQFVSAAEVEAQCDIERLGCITSKGQVFILDQSGKTAQTTVTAAHEMLHLAYRRLSEDQRAALAPLLDQAATDHATDINSELHDQTTADDRRDEAHSLLGTEYSPLPAELEQYYATYFSDRTKILASAQTEQE